MAAAQAPVPAAVLEKIKPMRLLVQYLTETGVPPSKGMPASSPRGDVPTQDFVLFMLKQYLSTQEYAETLTLSWQRLHSRTRAVRPKISATGSKHAMLAVVALAGVVLIASGRPVFAQSPPLQASCTVDQADFAKWFKTGQVTKDGFVTAADSLQAFDSLCDFYEWSWRMFLWQTSKAGGSQVFNSAPFFDLSDSNQLVSNQAGATTAKALRGAKRERTGRTGQAGLVGGVLMSQTVGANPDGSLVYYGIHVNDLYAYMASGVNSKELTGITQFPTSPAERDAIVAYAKKAYNVEIGDASSLALELKSSWVKVTGAMEVAKFITIQSDIPQFTRGSDQKWTWDGKTMERGVTLACVGYHLVGSTAGHPEMIWATFEHAGNAPDDNYTYVAGDGSASVKQNWNDDGTPIQNSWLFMDGQSKK